MSTRKIATSTLWQLGSQIVMAALSVLTVKFVAIGLTKELAGNYNSAYSYLQLFGVLADFGLYAVAVREVSRAKNREGVLGAVIVLRAIILCISLFSALAFVWLLPAWRGTPLPLGVTIASLVPFFTLLAGIVRTVFQVTYKMQYVFIAEVGQRIITTGLIGLFIFFGIRGSGDLHIYHLFLFWGGIGAFFLFYVSLRYGGQLIKIQPRWDPVLLKELLRKAAPYGVAFFCVALYRNLDATLIAILRPDYELQNAYYGFVLRMAEMGYLIPTFLLNSTLPILCERDEKGEDVRGLLGKTLLIILLLGSIACLFSLLWARPLVLLLTTEQYLSTAMRAGSDTALQILSLPLLLNGIVTYCFYVLLTKHQWQALVKTLLIGASLSLIINVLVIPTYGFVGAGMTSNVTHILLAVLLLPQAQRTLAAGITKKQIGQWAGFTALLATSLILLRPVVEGELMTVVGLGIMTILIVVFAFVFGIHQSLNLAH